MDLTIKINSYILILLVIFIFISSFTLNLYSQEENIGDNYTLVDPNELALTEEKTPNDFAIDLELERLDSNNVMDKLLEHIWNQIITGAIFKKFKRSGVFFECYNCDGENLSIRYKTKPYVRIFIKYSKEVPPFDFNLSGYYKKNRSRFFFGGNILLSDTELRAVLSGYAFIESRKSDFSLSHRQDIFLTDLYNTQKMRMVMLLRQTLDLDLDKISSKTGKPRNGELYISNQLGVGFLIDETKIMEDTYVGVSGGVSIDPKRNIAYPVFGFSIMVMPD